MVLRVVLSVTTQCSHPCRCASSSMRVSDTTESSIRYRASQEIQCTSLLSHLFLLEVAAEPFAQLQPGAQKARLHGRDAQPQRLRRFFRGKPFYVPEDKYDTKSLWQPLDGLAQN